MSNEQQAQIVKVLEFLQKKVNDLSLTTNQLEKEVSRIQHQVDEQTDENFASQIKSIDKRVAELEKKKK